MSERRLCLELRPSRPLALGIVALHLAAAACAWVVLPRMPGLLLALALAALGCASAWSRALLAAPGSVRRVEIDGPRIEVRLASGRTFAADLAERRYVGRCMVSLSIVRPVRRTLLVTRDMVEGDLFRRLRIWALWGRLPRVAAKQLPA